MFLFKKIKKPQANQREKKNHEGQTNLLYQSTLWTACWIFLAMC